MCGRIEWSPEKYVRTQQNGLVVLSIAEPDAGNYEAQLGTDLLCMYSVTVDVHRCAAPDKSKVRREEWSFLGGAVMFRWAERIVGKKELLSGYTGGGVAHV